MSVSYNFQPGRILARKYEVIAPLGRVREGEIYTLSECATGIGRTAKFFYPHIDPRGQIATRHAQKLHKLRHCPILMHYRTQETISLRGAAVTFLVSDLVQGELLGDFIERQPGRQLGWFEALHLLLSMVRGIESIHLAGESAGSLRLDNIMVRQTGLGFQTKLMELTTTNRTGPEHRRGDTQALVSLFHVMVANQRHAMPSAVIELLGTKRRPAVREWRDAGDLRYRLEHLNW